MRNDFMQFKQLDEENTELYIYGPIRQVSLFEKIIESDYGIKSEATSGFTFKEALEKVKTDNLVVRINSGGGSVSEALAIYSQLKDFKGKVITKVDGFAASAASVIFMSGEERIVPVSGLLMIHNALTYAQGNAAELRKVADVLEKVTKPSIDIYVEKTGQKEELIKQMMDDEAWITSDEAFDLGFSTIKSEGDTDDYQQNALQSLVLENRKLKKLVNNEEVNINYEKIAEVVSEVLINKKEKKKIRHGTTSYRKR